MRIHNKMTPPTKFERNSSAPMNFVTIHPRVDRTKKTVSRIRGITRALLQSARARFRLPRCPSPKQKEACHPVPRDPKIEKSCSHLLIRYFSRVAVFCLPTLSSLERHDKQNRSTTYPSPTPWVLRAPFSFHQKFMPEKIEQVQPQHKSTSK